MVHFEASRLGIGGLDADELVDIWPHFKRGWFYLVPIGLLLYYLIIERLSVARSAWFTLIAIGALITLVAAYSDETRGRLGAIFATLFLATFASQYLVGAGPLAAVAGAGTGGQSLRAAFAATVGRLGTISILSGTLTLATRPLLDSPLLEFDDAVDGAARTTAAAVGRPTLGRNGLYRLGVFTAKSMDGGARTAVPVVVAVAAAGIIPGVISVSGLGPNLVALIKAVAGGSLVLLLVVTAISSILLGMGMPTTVTYIILVSLLAPALTAFGVPELAAHLYILYFGVIADITPPVAVAAYAASGVAKSDAFQTGIEAFSLSLNKAIVPFAFVLTPGIVLLRRNPNAADLEVGEKYHVVGAADLLDVGYLVPEVVTPVLGVFLGVVALAATVIGFVYTTVSWVERAAFAVSSLLLMAPALGVRGALDVLGLVGIGTGGGDEVSIAVDVALRSVGVVLFAVLLVRNRRRGGTGTPAPPDAVETETEAA
jgi:TRAP transporter 4TM/12TM fusion protein